MASKGRAPPPHIRHPLNSGPAPVHLDPYPPAPRPHGGSFPPFEMVPPSQLMAHKLSTQHGEIEKLATENRRLAATHGTLRQDLAAAKHELQSVHAHISGVRAEKEQQARGMLEKMAAMEKELQAAEPLKSELQKARGEAQGLLTARQELISKVQQLGRDLQAAHLEAQHIPSLMTELDTLRREYQHCRATYDYEKKLYNDHLESLQVMEKNYMAMSREVEKLRAELTNSSNFDSRTGMPYSGPAGYNEGVPVGNYPSGLNAYSTVQGQGSNHPAGGVGGIPAGVPGPGGNSPHVLAQPGPYGPVAGHDAPRGPAYGVPRPTGYDPHRGPTLPNYDAQRGQTGLGYDSQKGPGLEARGPYVHSYDQHRNSGEDVQRGANFDGSSRGAVGPQGQVPMNNNVAYGLTPGGRVGGGYEPTPRGGNPIRR